MPDVIIMKILMDWNYIALKTKQSKYVVTNAKIVSKNV